MKHLNKPSCYLKNENIDFENEKLSKIDELLLRNLYTLGTISKKTKNHYETPE